MQETGLWALGWEDLLEKEMETQYSILTWETHMDRGPGILQSMELSQTRLSVHVCVCTRAHTHRHSFSKLVLKSSFLCHCNSTLLHFPEITTFEFLQLIFMELSPYLRVIYIHYVFLIFPSWALSTDFLLWQVQSWFSFIPLHHHPLHTLFSSSCSQYNYIVLWFRWMVSVYRIEADYTVLPFAFQCHFPPWSWSFSFVWFFPLTLCIRLFIISLNCLPITPTRLWVVSSWGTCSHRLLTYSNLERLTATQRTPLWPWVSLHDPEKLLLFPSVWQRWCPASHVFLNVFIYLAAHRC